MKRYSIAYVLLFFMVLNLSSYIAIKVYHQACNDYITTYFCVNKDKPELHCNGKCHINKLIKAANIQKNQSINTLSSILFEYLPCQIFSINYQYGYKDKEVQCSRKQYFIQSLFVTRHTPPPQV